MNLIKKHSEFLSVVLLLLFLAILIPFQEKPQTSTFNDEAFVEAYSQGLQDGMNIVLEKNNEVFEELSYSSFEYGYNAAMLRVTKDTAHKARKEIVEDFSFSITEETKKAINDSFQK